MNELRMYNEADLEECAKIYEQAFKTPPLNYDFLTAPKAERYLRDIVNTPCFMGYTYRIDDEIVAFCFGKLDNYFQGTVFEVTEFAVNPILQRNGLGTYIMQLLEEKLAMYGVSAVSLFTSRILPAYNFYLKNGYEEVTENVTLIKQLQ